MKQTIQEFFEFIREQGVVTLAIGFILGGAVTKVVNSLVQDIINPIIGPILGVAGGLETAVIHFGNINILIGNFISALIDFIIIALVVYFGVKILKLDKIDKKK